MDIAAILSTTTGLATGLKVATGLITGILETKNEFEAKGKFRELQTALLEVQAHAISATTAQFELLERVRALKEQLNAFNDWDEQGPRYTLVCPWQNAAQVYALRKASSDGEVAHFLCPNCFLRRQRVIFNPVVDKGNRYRVALVCPSCKAKIDTAFIDTVAPKYAEEYERATT